jgi:hypothetical protein
MYLSVESGCLQQLYEKLKLENKNGIIVIVGDILDKKLWVNCGFNFVGNGWQ